MQFLKDLLRNLGLLVVIAIVLIAIFPQQMSQIVDLYGGVLGPLAIVLLIIVALPRSRSR